MRRQFEDGWISRAASTKINTHVCTQLISLFVCTYNAHAHTYIAVDPLPCGKISRAAGFRGAARFRGNMVLYHGKIWRKYSTYYSYIALKPNFPLKVNF